MKKPLLVALCLCFISLAAFAQRASIKGFVIDSVGQHKLENATVSVLRSKDSTLVKFTRANQDGHFVINNLPTGNFFLLVSYPSYADYVESIILDSIHKDRDFGVINMTTKATLLANVIIKGKAASIRIKGDTTEFDAGAYRIEPNSKVEDLLKQLPGIQIDSKGKITAQGKTVNKVLVDGEEFFGDDPTLVTKNIRGDMVDKVQLYDKKSDQATFTGIDDDKKDKTINIKLKEDKKNGYFGKTDLAGATDEFYQAQAMVNAFKGKKKFSAYGTIGNTGKIGMGWQDSDKYASSNDIEVTDDGSIMINMGPGDDLDSFDGQYHGQGIPVTKNGGVHYDAKWNDDKESLNSNYKLGSINLSGIRNMVSQNNLPDGIINTNSNESFDNFMFRQKLDGVYQIKLDTTSNLKISVEGMLKNSETRNNYSTNSLRNNNTLLNKNVRSLSNEGHNKSFNANLLWTKKMKKKGRTLSLNIRQSINDNKNEGFLHSVTTFYDGGAANDSIVDQFKISNAISSVFSLNLAYTEPLSKKLSLILNYGLGINNNSVNSKSLNQDGSGKYTSLDSLFSNHYELDQLSNQGGAIFNFKGKKATLNFGTKVSTVRFGQTNLQRNNTFERNFINWNPQASISYKLAKQEAIRLSYNGNTQQPSIDDINPVRINTDPLNITLGNPDLKPSFNNGISMDYDSYKVITGQAIWAGGSYNFTSNPIVSNIQTDTAGRSIYQSTNIQDKHQRNYYLYVNGQRKVNSIDANIGIVIDASGNTSFNYANSELNQTKSNSYAVAATLGKYKEKKYALSFRGGPTYKTNQSSLQKNINDNGWGFNGGADLSFHLPLKVEIFSDANYEFRSKTQSFNSDFKRLLWNARVTKNFLKSDNLKLSFFVNDLLNQNKGFERSAYGNMITQNSYTTVRRYYMASLTWDFSKMGAASAK